MNILLRKFLDFFKAALEQCVRFLPDHAWSFAIRRLYFNRLGARLGEGVVLCEGVVLYEPQRISIGAETGVGRHVTFDPFPAKISVGSNVLIAQDCLFRAGNHVFINPEELIRLQGHSGKDIEIEDDVWIGAKCVIVAGVKIGKGAVISAGSLVVKDVPSYSIVCGVPAQQIGVRE